MRRNLKHYNKLIEKNEKVDNIVKKMSKDEQEDKIISDKYESLCRNENVRKIKKKKTIFLLNIINLLSQSKG
jgi:hypothetical protein